MRRAPRAVLPARGSFFFWRRKRRTKKKTSPGPKKTVGLFRTFRGRGLLPVFTDCFAGFQESFATEPQERGAPGRPLLLFLLPHRSLPEAPGGGSKREEQGVRNHPPGAKDPKRDGKPKRPPSSGASRMKAAGSSPKVSQRARDPQNDPKRSFWDRPSAPFFWTVHGPFSLGKTQRKWGVQMHASIEANDTKAQPWPQDGASGAQFLHKRAPARRAEKGTKRRLPRPEGGQRAAPPADAGACGDPGNPGPFRAGSGGTSGAPPCIAQ